MSTMTLANELRRVCGHDSRSVDGCLHCEAADALEQAHLAQPAQGRGEAVVGAKGKFISESGYCFSGTLDSVLYKVWLNDGSLVTIGRDEFILDANPTRSSPAVAPDDERLHSGSAEDVAQWLYANGHHDAAFTVRQQLDVRNERIRALESTHLTQPAQAVDVEPCKCPNLGHCDGSCAPYVGGGGPGLVRAEAYRVDWPDEPDLGHYFAESPVEGARNIPLTRALSGEKAGWREGKARAMALHAAVGAIYFADGSDYLSALWEVVRELGPDLVDELAANPSAVWHRTMAETDRFTLPTPPTDGEE